VLFENVRFLKVTFAEDDPFIVKSLPVPPFPAKVELEFKPSMVNAKFFDVRFAPSGVIVPTIMSLSPSEVIFDMATPKFPNAVDSLVPSILPAPVDET